MPLLAHKKEWTLHPTGSYIAKIGAVGPIETKYGDRRMWRFLTGETDEEGNELSIPYFTGPELSLNSKLLELAEVVTGKTFEELSNPFDLETLIGEKLQIHVVHEKANDGSIRDVVQGIFPMPPAEAASLPEDEDSGDTLF